MFLFIYISYSIGDGAMNRIVFSCLFIVISIAVGSGAIAHRNEVSNDVLTANFGSDAKNTIVMACETSRIVRGRLYYDFLSVFTRAF